MTNITQVSPLTQYERELIATVLNQVSELPTTHEAQIWTISVDFDNGVVWVYLRDRKRLPFNRCQFKQTLAEVKASKNKHAIA